jgi:hypothetical protein
MMIIPRRGTPKLLLLLGALACTHQPQPAQPGPNPSQIDALRDLVTAHESAGMKALIAGDTASFNASIADDAIFVDSHGPATKAEVVSHTGDFHLRDFSMADVRVVSLAPEAALIVYTLTESGTSHAHDFSAHVHISSVWRKQGPKWLCAFSQETAAK